MMLLVHLVQMAYHTVVQRKLSHEEFEAKVKIDVE
jgi:hypothetical protein